MARSSLPHCRGKRLLLVTSAYLIQLANASGEIVRFVNPHEIWSFGQYYNADKSQQIVRSDVIASDPEYDPGCDLREIQANGEFNYNCYLYQVPVNRQNINSIDYSFSSLHSVKESMDSLGLSGDAKLNIAGKSTNAAVTAAGGFLNEKINYDKKTTIAAEFAFTSHVLSLDHLSIMKPSLSDFQSAQEMGATHYVQEIVFGGRLSCKVTFDKSDESEKKIGRFMGAISVMAGAGEEEGERKKRHADFKEPVVQFHDNLKFKKGDFLTLKERYGNDTRLLEHYRMIEKRKRLAPIVMKNIHNIDCLHDCFCPCEDEDFTCIEQCDQSCLNHCNACDSLCDRNCNAGDTACLEDCEENSHCRARRQAYGDDGSDDDDEDDDGSGDDGSGDDSDLTGDSAVDAMTEAEQEVFSQNDMNIDTAANSQASTIAATDEDFVCPGDLSRRKKRSTLELEAAGCININDFELSSVTGLQIKIIGNPAPIDAPLTLIEGIAYIGKYKDYLVDELNGEGVPSKVVLGEVKHLVPGLAESLFYLPSEFQLNAAVNFLDDYDQTIAYSSEYENFFNTFARSNYDISLPFLSAKAKFENLLQGSKASLLNDLVSLDLSNPRVDLSASFRAYYNTETGAPCQSGEKRYIRAIKHMQNLIARCDDKTASGYCSGHGKCIIDETEDCAGISLRCECDNGWSSKNMTEPGQCNHNVCELNGSGEGSLCGAGDCIPDTRFERGFRCACAPGSYGDNCQYNFCDVQQYRDVCDNNAKACMPRTDLANGPYYTCLCDHKHNSMSDNQMIQGVDFHADGVSSKEVKESNEGWTVIGDIPEEAREKTRSFYIMISNPTSTVTLKFSNIQVCISGADQQTKIVQNGDRVWFSSINKPLANKVTEDTVFWFSWDITSDRFVFGTGLSIGRNVIANVQKRSDYTFVVPLLNFDTVLAKVYPRITREDSIGSDNDFAVEEATDQTATIVIPVIKSYQDIDGYNCEFEKCNDNNDNRRRHCNFRGSCKRETELTRENRAHISTFMSGDVDTINTIIEGWLNQKGYACVCDAGWYGPKCEFHICSVTRNICLQHGLQHPYSQCVASEQCPDGYWNPNDNRYYELDNAGCIGNRQVPFKCENCASGWHGPAVGGQCQVSPCFEDSSHLTTQQLYEPGRLVNKCTRYAQFATCQPNNKNATNTPFYTCICPPGFSGDHCEINECDNFHGENYCRNGGVCSQSAEGPTCSCPSYAYGKRCDKTICDPYASTRGYPLDSPCQNGAKCEVQAASPYYRCVPTTSCRHDPQSEHQHCQINACNDPAKLGCQNGSLCVLDDETPDGYRCVCNRPWQDKNNQCRNPEDICATRCTDELLKDEIPCHKCKGDTCVQDFNNEKGYRCECDTHTRGTFCEYQRTCPGDKLAKIDTDRYSRSYTLTCVDPDECDPKTHYSHISRTETHSYAGQYDYTQLHYNLLNRTTDDNTDQWCLPCHPDCNGCSAPYGLGYCTACQPEEETTTAGETITHDRLLFKDMGQADCVRRDFCEDTDTESFFIDEDAGTCERCHRNCGGYGCIKPNNENGCKSNIACHTKVVIEGMRQATAKASLVIILIDPDNTEYNLNFEVTESRSYYVGCLEQRVEVRAAKLKITSMLDGDTTFEWWVRSIHVDYSKDGNWRAIPLVGVDEELFPRPFQRILITDENFDRITEDNIEEDTVTITIGDDYKTIIPRENQNYFLDPELGTGYFIAQIYSTESILLTMGNIIVRLGGADGISSISQWCDATLEDCADSPYTSINNAKNVVSSPVQPLSRVQANPEPRLFWFSWKASSNSTNSFSVGMGGRPGVYGILQAEFISAQNNFALPYKLAEISDVLMKMAPSVSPYQVTYPNRVNKTATAYVLDNGVSFSTYKLLKEYLGSTHICSGAVGEACELSVPALTKYERFEERLGCDDRPLPFNKDFFVYRGSVYHVPKDEDQRNFINANEGGITRVHAQEYCQSIGVGFNLWCPKPDEFEIMKIGWANNYLLNQNYFTGYGVGDIGSFDIRYDYVHEDVQLQSNWWTCETSSSASLSKYYREILPDVGTEDVCINVESDGTYGYEQCENEVKQNRFFVCAWDCGAREGTSRLDDFCLMTDEYGACLLLDCPTRYPEGTRWGDDLAGTDQNFIATVDRSTCVPDDISHCMGYEATEDGHRCVECEDDYIIEQNECVPYVEHCLEYDLNLPTIVAVDGSFTAHGCATCIFGRGVSGDRSKCVPEVVGCRYHSSLGYGCEECFSRDALTEWGTCKFVLDGTRSEQEIGSKIGDIYPILPEGQKNYVRQATGRLETTIDGGNIWGTVCDDGFDEREATAACRNMGFRWGTALEREKVEAGDEDMLIMYDNLQCSEPGMDRLYDCYHQGPLVHDCTHEEDVGVACYHQLYKIKEHDWAQRVLGQNTTETDDDEYMIYDTFRIIGDASYGRVEIKTDLHQEWQSMCTTDEASHVQADLMCRNAGFTGGFKSFSEKVRPAPLGEFRMCEAKGEGYVPLGVECYPVTTCHNEQCSRIKTPLSTIECVDNYHWNGEQCVCDVPEINNGVRLDLHGETVIYEAFGNGNYNSRNCASPMRYSSPMSVDDAQRLINLSDADTDGKKYLDIDSTYNHDTGKVTNSEGREIGQNIARWCDNFPSNETSHTVALISAHADPSDPSSEETLCMFNADPSGLTANLICVWKSSDCETSHSGNANDQMAVDENNDGNQKIGYVEVSDNYGQDYHRVLTSFSPRHYSVDPTKAGVSYGHDSVGQWACLHIHVKSMTNQANDMQINVEITFSKNTTTEVYNFGLSHEGEDENLGFIGSSMMNSAHDPNEFYDDAILDATNQRWCFGPDETPGSGVTGRPSSVKLSAKNAAGPVDIVVDLQLHYQSLIYRIACPSSSQGTSQGMYISLLGSSAPSNALGNPYCQVDARGASLSDNQVDMNLVLDARFDLDRDDYVNSIQTSRTDFSQATCNGLGYKFGWEKNTWIKTDFDGMHGLPENKNLATFLPNPIREAFYIDQFLFIVMTKHDSSNDDWMASCPDHTTEWDLTSYASHRMSGNQDNGIIPASIKDSFTQNQLNLLYKVFRDKHFTSMNIQLTFLRNAAGEQDTTPYRWLEESIICVADPDKNDLVEDSLNVVVDTGYDRFRTGGREVESTNIDTTIGNFMTPVLEKFDRVNYYKFRAQSEFPIRAVLYDASSPVEDPETEFLADLPESIKGTGYLDLRQANSSEWFEITTDLEDLNTVEIRMHCHEGVDNSATVRFGSVQETYLDMIQTNVEDEVYRFTWTPSTMYKIRLARYGNQVSSRDFASSLGTGLAPKTLSVKGTACEFWFYGQGFSKDALVSSSNTRKENRFEVFEDIDNVVDESEKLENARFASLAVSQPNGEGAYVSGASAAIDDDKGTSQSDHYVSDNGRFFVDLTQPTTIDFVKVWPRDSTEGTNNYEGLMLFAGTVFCPPMETYPADYVQSYLLADRKPLIFVCPAGTVVSTIQLASGFNTDTVELAEIEVFRFQSRKPVSINKYPLVEYQPLRWTQGKCLPDNMVRLEQGNFILTDNTRQYCFNLCNQHSSNWVACQINPEGFDEGCYITHDGDLAVSQAVTTDVTSDRLHVCYFREVPTSREEAVALKTRPSFEVWINEPEREGFCYVRILACGREVAQWNGNEIFKATESRSFYLSWFDDTLIFGEGHDIGERAIIALAQMSKFCDVNVNELAFTGLAPPDSTTSSTSRWLPPGYTIEHTDDFNSMAYGGNFNNRNPRINTIDYGYFSHYPESTVKVNGYEIAVFDCDKRFSFFEAKARCQREGGSLIDVDSFNGRAISVNQLAEISEHFQQTCQLAVNNYWIDLLYSCTDSAWKRRNGEAFGDFFTDVESGKDIKYWATNQPVPIDSSDCRPLSNCVVSAGWQGQLNDFGFQSSGCHYKIRGAVCMMPPKPTAREEVRDFINTSPQKSIEEFAQLMKNAAFSVKGSDFNANLADDEAFVIDSCRPTNERTLCNSIYPRDVLEAMQSQFGNLQTDIDDKKREICVYPERATACIVDINKRNMKFSLDNFGDIGTPAYLDKTLRNTLALVKQKDEEEQNDGMYVSPLDVGYSDQTPGKAYHANVDTRQLEKAYFGVNNRNGVTKNYDQWQSICKNYHPEARIWEPRDHIEMIDVFKGIEYAFDGFVDSSFVGIQLDYLNTLSSNWFGQQSLNYVYASDRKPFRFSLHADWGTGMSRGVQQLPDDGDASVMIIGLGSGGDSNFLEYKFVDKQQFKLLGTICEVDISSKPDSTGDLDHKISEFSADDVDKWMDFTSSSNQNSYIGSKLRFVSTPMYAKDAEVHCRSLHENSQLYQPAIGRVKDQVDNSPEDANVERWLSIVASNIQDTHMWLGWRRNPFGVWDIRGRHGENIAGIGSVENGGSYMDKGSNNWGTVTDKSAFEQFKINDNRADVVKTSILRSKRANTQGYEFVSADSERLPFVCEIPEYVREEKIYEIPTCKQVNFHEARSMCQDIGGDLMQASNVKNTNGHGRRDSYEKALLYYSDKCGRDSGFWTGAQITCGGDAPRPWNYISNDEPLLTRNMFIQQPERDVNEILSHNSKCSTAKSNCEDVLPNWDTCETFSMNIQISGTDLCFDGSITNINANGNYLGHKPCEEAEPLIAIKCGDEYKIMSSTGRFLYFDAGAIKFTSGADCTASSFKTSDDINTLGSWVRDTCLTDVSSANILVPLSKDGLGRVSATDCENNFRVNIKLTSKCGAPLEEDGDWVDLGRPSCADDGAAVMGYFLNDAGWIDSNVENHHGVVCVLSPERSRSTPKFNVDYTAAQGLTRVREMLSEVWNAKELEYTVQSGDLLVNIPRTNMEQEQCDYLGGSLAGTQCFMPRTSNLYDRYTTRPAKPYLGQSFDCYQMTEKHIFQCSIAGMPKRNTPTINYLAFHEHVRAQAGTYQPEGSGEVGRKNMIEFYFENTAGVACSTGFKPCEPHQIRDTANICRDRDECNPNQWGAGMLPNPMNLARPPMQSNTVDVELQPAIQNFEYRSGVLSQMCVAPISPLTDLTNTEFRIGSYRGGDCKIAGDDNRVIVRSARSDSPTTMQEAYDRDHYLIKNNVKRSYWTTRAVKPCLYEFFTTCRDEKSGTLTPLGRSHLKTLTVQECEDACFLMKKENSDGTVNDSMCYDWNQTDGACQCSIRNDLCDDVGDNWQNNQSPYPSLLSFRRGSFVERGKRCCVDQPADEIDINDMRIAADNVAGTKRDDERLACQQICNADLDCKFWSVNHDTKQCRLGSDLTAYQGSPQSSTGADTCGQIADADSGCVVNPGKGSNTDLMHHSEIQFVEKYNYNDQSVLTSSSEFMANGWKWSTLFTPAGVRTDGNRFDTNSVYRFYIGRLNHARFEPAPAIESFRAYSLHIFVKRASRPFKISVSGCTHVADSNWRSDGYSLPSGDYSRSPWKFDCKREFNFKYDPDFQTSMGEDKKGMPNYLGIKIETSNGDDANAYISSIQIKRNQNVVNKECTNPGKVSITSVTTGHSPALTWWWQGRAYQAPWKNRFTLEYVPDSDELYYIKMYGWRAICMRTDRVARNSANLKLRDMIWIESSMEKICTFRIKKMYMSEQRNWRYMILPEKFTRFGDPQTNDVLVDQYALVCGNQLNGQPISNFGKVYRRYNKCFFAAQKHTIGQVEYNSDWVLAQSLFEIKEYDMWRSSRNPNCLNNLYLYNFADQQVPMRTRGATTISVGVSPNFVDEEYPFTHQPITNAIYAGVGWRYGKQWGGYVDPVSGEVGYVHENQYNSSLDDVSMTTSEYGYSGRWKSYYIFKDCCEGGKCENMVADDNGLFEGETVGVDAYYRCVCPPDTFKILVRYGVYKCSKSGGSATYCNAGRANPQYYNNNPDDEPLAAECDSCADPNARVDPRDPTRCTRMRSYCKFGRGFDLTNTADLSEVHEHLWRYNLINGRNYEQCKPGMCRAGYFEQEYTVEAGTADWDDLNPNQLTVRPMKCVLKVCTCYENRSGSTRQVGYGSTGAACPENGQNHCRSCYGGYVLDGNFCEDNRWYLARPGGNIGFIRTGWGRTFRRTSPGQYIPSYYSYWYSYRVRHRRWSYYRPWYWVYYRWWWHWIFRWFGRWTYWYQTKKVYRYSWSVKGYPIVKIMRRCDRSSGCEYAWGSVCDDGFGRNEATSWCTNLGYDSRCTGIPGGGYSRRISRFNARGGRGLNGNRYMIAIDDLRCPRIRSNIGSQCRKRPYGTHNCNHWEDVILECAHP